MGRRAAVCSCSLALESPRLWLQLLLSAIGPIFALQIVPLGINDLYPFHTHDRERRVTVSFAASWCGLLPDPAGQARL